MELCYQDKAVPFYYYRCVKYLLFIIHYQILLFLNTSYTPS